MSRRDQGSLVQVVERVIEVNAHVGDRQVATEHMAASSRSDKVADLANRLHNHFGTTCSALRLARLSQ